MEISSIVSRTFYKFQKKSTGIRILSPPLPLVNPLTLDRARKQARLSQVRLHGPRGEHGKVKYPRVRHDPLCKRVGRPAERDRARGG